MPIKKTTKPTMGVKGGKRPKIKGPGGEGRRTGAVITLKQDRIAQLEKQIVDLTGYVLRLIEEVSKLKKADWPHPSPWPLPDRDPYIWPTNPKRLPEQDPYWTTTGGDYPIIPRSR